MHRKPNYSKLYPDVRISPEVATLLGKTDNQLEYAETRRKQERIRKDKHGNDVVLPCLEQSLEAMCEAGCHFPSPAPSPEELLIKAVEVDALHCAIAELDDDEAEIIHAIFWLGQSIRSFADDQDMSKSAADRLRKRALCKLRVFLKELRD